MKYFLMLLLFSAFTISLSAQIMISGKIIDKLNGKAIEGVHIQSSENTHTLSGIDGNFRLFVQSFPIVVKTQHLSYAPSEHTIVYQSDSVFLIKLTLQNIELNEVSILDGLAKEGDDPVALHTILAEKIQSELGDRPLPEVLNFTPGIFASRDGGGSGDASVQMRGFSQENISVLLNGIPINGAENGLIYWNNWMGLTEATSCIQVQKGIGASLVSSNSVGGTINILTEKPGIKGGSLSFQTTDYGNTKIGIQAHSGERKGISTDFLITKSSGPGYIDGTYVKGWAYFFNMRIRLSANQILLVNLLGGPEHHGQRNLKLSKTEVDTYGYQYNKEWGTQDGKLRNASENFYHKPFLSVNHYLSLQKERTITNILYYSPGWGGGKWNDSFNYGPGIFDFKTTTGQIDWQGIYDYNKQSDARYQLESGELAEGFSKVVQTEYLASHHWAGWMGSLEKRTNFGSFSIGSHYRYFSSTIKQKLTDLLGGPYYIDDYSWSLAGVDGRNEIRNPGDIIRANNGAIMHQLTFFGQSEGRYKRFHYYFGANITGNSYQRTDVYNYPDHEYSESVERLSYQLKAGLTAQITDKQHLFANVAWLNQSPYYKFVFGNFNNEPSYPLYNEAVQSIEGGYHLSSNPFTLKISTYRTLWQNVAFLSDEYIPLDENHETRAMVSGLNALHVGFEAESHLKVNSLLGFGAFVSLGNWRWTNDVQAKLLNSYDQVIDTVSVYAKGLYVGGQPQFQAGIFSKITICKSYTFLVETQYNDRQFASFDPQSRNEITDRTQPYRLPAYFLMNMRLKIPLKIFSINSTFSANCENLFNTHYILKGEDGVTHTLESFRGFWSFGRTFNFGLRLQL